MKLAATTLLASFPLVAANLFAQTNDAITESTHVCGPHALSGWTASRIVPEAEAQGPLPIELVLAHQGRVIRRIEGSPFIWKWMFQDDGRTVVYEDGPLHYGIITCYRVEIASGRLVSSFDCGNTPLNRPPGWVTLLEPNLIPSPVE